MPAKVQLAPQAARLNKQTLRAINSSQALDEYSVTTKNRLVSEDPLTNLMTTAYAYAVSTEQREGIMAFLEKRPPKF